MRTFFLSLVVFAGLAASALADKRAPFYGAWGTAQQCAGALLKPEGTVTAKPFEISAQWLRQGETWCRLSWFPVEARDDGFFSGARAHCGEDGVRDYFLRMSIKGEQLTLRWDLFQANGPLARCVGS